MSNDNVVRTVLRVDGQPAGAVESLQRVGQEAKKLGGDVIKVSEQINVYGQRYATQLQNRMNALRADVERFQRLQGAGGTDAIRAAEERLAQQKDQLIVKSEKLTTAEKTLAEAEANRVRIQTQLKDASNALLNVDDKEVNAEQQRAQLAVQVREHMAELRVAEEAVANAKKQVAAASEEEGARMSLVEAATKKLTAAERESIDMSEKRKAAVKELEAAEVALAQHEQAKAGNPRLKYDTEELEKERQLILRVEQARMTLGKAESDETKASSALAAAVRGLSDAERKELEAKDGIVRAENDLSKVKKEVSNAVSREEQALRAKSKLTEQITALENRQIAVTYKFGEGLKTQAVAVRENQTELQKFLSSLMQVKLNMGVASSEFIVAAARAQDGARAIRTIGSELKGLGQVVGAAKAAWATYAQSMQKVALTYQPNNQGLLAFIRNISQAVRASVNWNTVLRQMGLAARSMIGSITSTAAGLGRLVLAFGNVGRAIGIAVTAVGRFAAGAGRVLGAVNNVRSGLSRLTEGFATTGTHIAGFAVKLQGAQMGLYALGGGLTAFASQGKSLLGDLVNVAGEFQNKVINIKAILGNSAGMQGFSDSMRDLAIYLGNATMFGPNEAADVITELIKGGMDIKDVMGQIQVGADGVKKFVDSATGSVLALSTATGQDLTTSTNTVIAATTEWANMNLKAGDAVNDLTKVANATASDVSQLAGGMKNAGAVAAQMGVSFHDTLTLLGALSNAGLKGPEGGTALRYFLLNLIPTTEKQINLMKDLGLVTYNWGEASKYAAQHGTKLTGDMTHQMDQLYQQFAGTDKTFEKAIEDGDRAVGKFQSFMSAQGILSSVFVNAKTGALKGANEILDILGKVIADKGPVEGTKLMSALFGERGGSKAAAPLMLQFQKNLTDFTNKQAELAKAKAGGDLERVKALQAELDKMSPNLIDGINKQLADYSNADEIATQRTKGFMGALDFLQSSVEGMQIALGEPLLQPLGDMLRALGDGVNLITQWGEKNPEMVKMVGTVIALGIGFATVVGPVLMLAAAWPVLISTVVGLVSSALPLLGILTLLGGAFSAILTLVSNGSPLQSALMSLGDVFKDLLPRALMYFEQIYLSVFLPIGNAMISIIINGIIPAVAHFAQFMGEEVPRALGGLGGFITGTVLPVLGNLVGFFMQVLPLAIQIGMLAWSQLIAPAMQYVSQLIMGYVLPTLMNLGIWLMNFLPTAIRVVGQFMSGVLFPVLTTIANVISQVVIPAIVMVTEWLGQHLPPVLTFLGSVWQNLVNPVLEKAGALFNMLLPPILNVLGVISDFLFPALQGIAEVLGPILGAALDGLILAFKAVGQVWDALAQGWNSDFLGIKSAIEWLGQKIGEFFGWIGDMLKTFASDTDKALKEAADAGGVNATAMGNNIQQGLRPGLQGAVLDTQAAGGMIASTFGDLGEMMKPLSDKVVNALVTMTGKTKEEVQNMRKVTIDELVKMKIEGGQAAGEIGDSIVYMLEQAYGRSFPKTIDWKNATLGVIISTIDPAGTATNKLGNVIQQGLAQELGVTMDKTVDWRHMTLTQLESMAQPGGVAADNVGRSIRDFLSQQLGISLQNTNNFGSLTIDALNGMVKPAGDSGYATGFNFSGGIVFGLDANMQAVVARVKYLREQLKIAMDIETKMQAVAASGSSNQAAADVNEFRATRQREAKQAKADAAAAQAQKGGVPSFILDQLAGPDPGAPPSFSGVYTGYTGKNGGNYDPNSDNGDSPPDMGGSHTTPYNQNTNYPGAPDSAAAKDKKKGATSNTDKQISAAEEAANLAKKVADAIKDGMDALRRLMGFTMPAGLEAKAKEFANAVATIIAQLQTVATRFKQEALLHTEDFLDAANKAMDTINKALDAFKKLDGFVAPPREQVAKLVHMVDVTVQMFKQVADQYKGEALGNTMVYSEAASQVVDLIGKGADAFTKVNDFVAPQMDAVKTLIDTTDMTLKYLAPLANKWAPDALEIVSTYADAAGKVTDGLGHAADLFIKLNSAEVTLDGAAPKAEKIAADSDAIMGYFRTLVNKGGWNAEGANVVADYAEAAGKTMDSLGKAVDFFTKLNDPKTDLSYASDRVSQLVSHSMEVMGWLSKLVQDLPGTPAWNTKNATMVGDYADNVGKAMDGLAKASDFFQKVLDPKFILKDPTQIVQQIVQHSLAMMRYLSDLWQKEPSWTVDNADKVAQYAEAAGKVADALGKAADFFDHLRTIKTPFQVADARVAELTAATAHMMATFLPVVPQWDTHMVEGTTNFAEASAKVADALTKALAFFDALVRSKTSYRDLQARVKELTAAVSDMMATFLPVVPAWDGTMVEAVANFAEASAKVAEGLSKSIEFLDALKGSKTSFKDLAGRVRELMTSVRDIMDTATKLTPADFESEGISTFMDTAGKVMDSLGKGVEFLSALANTKKLASSEQAYKLAQDMVAFVRAYEVALANVQIGLDSASEESQVIAGNIADSQGKVLAALGTAFDLYTKLGEYIQPRKFNPQAAFNSLLSFLLDVVRQFAAVRDQFAQATDEETAKLAETVGSTVSGIGGALDLFDKLKDFHGVSASRIDSFINGLTYVLVKLKGGLLDIIAPEMLDTAQAFGEKLGPAFQLLASALELFKALTGEEDKDGKSNGLRPVDINAIEAFIQYLRYTIQRLRDGLLNEIAPDMLDLASEFGTKLGPAIDAMSKALGIFLDIQGGGDKEGLKPIDPDAIGALVGSLYLLLHHWNNILIGGEFQGDFAERSDAFAATVGSVLDSVKSILDLAKEIAQAEGDTGAISKLPLMMQNIGNALREVLGVTLPATADANKTAMDDIANTTSSQLANTGQSWRDTFQTIKDMLLAETNFKQKETLTGRWVQGILGVMIDRLEGKNGAHVQIRVGIRNMLDDVTNLLLENSVLVKQPWVDAMMEMTNATIAAVQSIISQLQSLAGMSGSLTFSFQVNGQGAAPPGQPVVPATDQPQLAEGGFVTGNKAVSVTIGDGNEPEMVLPLSKAKQYGFGGSAGNTYQFNINRLAVEKTTDLPEQMRRERQIADSQF